MIAQNDGLCSEAVAEYVGLVDGNTAQPYTMTTNTSTGTGPFGVDELTAAFSGIDLSEGERKKNEEEQINKHAEALFTIFVGMEEFDGVPIDKLFDVIKKALIQSKRIMKEAEEEKAKTDPPPMSPDDNHNAFMEAIRRANEASKTKVTPMYPTLNPHKWESSFWKHPITSMTDLFAGKKKQPEYDTFVCKGVAEKTPITLTGSGTAV